MIEIAGYTPLEPIYQSDKTIVVRARRDADGQSVVIKTINSDFPDQLQLARARREYEITRSLADVPGVIRVYELAKHGNGLALIIEDINGVSLNRLHPFADYSLTQMLEIWIQLADILGAVHRRNIIHKDFKPQNVIINPATGELRLIDFSISSQLSREVSFINSPELLEGTLAYISPEQTGRMNRALDYRSDYYSLGVMFYEMLTGRLPYESVDQLELIHNHIARAPQPPHEVEGASRDVPPAISQIILKLMAKTAEDRYQSSSGLHADLNRCLEALRAGPTIPSFTPGQNEILDRFQIPQKLYGRDAELETLLAAFERAADGATELVLVSGHSGIGKSVLVNEVHKPIVRRHGYFIAGKFDQFKRDVPYSALIQSFQDLVRQVLIEDEKNIARLADSLRSTLGANGQVICEVIPDVALIIGQQPPVPEVPAAEAAHRFRLVFQNFIRVFAQPDHPLTLFIDDLQWADAASLGLLIPLLTDPESRYLLFLGAFRDNEVDEAHPLRTAIHTIQKTGASVTDIFLAPLDAASVTRLIRDTLFCDAERAAPLAELVMRKTAGNPFFVSEFLKSVYQNGLLNFSAAAGRWEWDVEQIRALDITDNVVDLMAAKIQKLTPATRRLLQLAACIGNQFDLSTLALVYEKSAGETARDLNESLREGLVLPTSDSYKYFSESAQSTAKDTDGAGDHEAVTAMAFRFVHDRVQAAAYGLLDESAKHKTHLNIGRFLLASTPPEHLDDVLTDVVSHLNSGRGLIDDPVEKIRLAGLNHEAGRRAKASAAFASALEFFRTGRELLPANAWDTQYDLCLGLRMDQAEMEYVNTNFPEAEALYGEILTRISDPAHIADVCVTRIDLYSSQLLMEKCIEIGQEALERLNLSLPKKAGKGHVMIELLQTIALMRGRTAEAIEALPDMTDARQLAIAKILVAGMLTPAYLLGSDLMPIILLRCCRQHIKHGNSIFAPSGYLGFAGIISTSLKEIERGEELSQMALRLVERYNNKDIACRLYYQYGNFQRDWSHHVNGREVFTMKSFEAALEIGKLNYVSYCLISLLGSPMWIGHEPIPTVLQRFEKYAPVLTRINQTYADTLLSLIKQYALNLRGEAADPLRLVGEHCDEDALLADWEKTNNFTNIFYLYFFKAVLAYLFDDLTGALDFITRAGKIVDAVYGQIFIPLRVFYHALILTALAERAGGLRRRGYIRQVRKLQKEMRVWARHCPENYQSKYALVEAQLAELADDPLRALEMYDAARTAARENDFLFDEALANELAGRYCVRLGRKEFARLYLNYATYLYERWGAVAKSSRMAVAMGAHLQSTETLSKTSERSASERSVTERSLSDSRTILNTRVSASSDSSSAETFQQSFDLTTVLKSSQNLSAEFDLGKLLKNMMRIVLENAGARKGYFLLATKGRFTIEAEATIEGEAPVSGEDVAVLRNLEFESIPESGTLAKSVVNYVARTRETQVLTDAAREGRFANDPHVVANRTRSVLCMPLLQKGQLTGLLYLENNLSAGAFTEGRLRVLNLLSSQAAISIENARLYRNLETALEQERVAKQAQIEINRAYSRFVPQEFLRLLGQQNIINVELGDHVLREMTVLFSDIRSFTSLSEKLSPKENFQFINSYLRVMGPVVREHNGFIDKYIGDAIMALFPTPEDGFRAAVAMLQALKEFNAQRVREGSTEIGIGIGINTGELMLGTIGEHNRMEGTVISDTVNLASRLEGLNKFYGTSLITTLATMQTYAPAGYEYRKLGLVHIVGKKEPVAVVEVFSPETDALFDARLRNVKRFHEGVELYQRADFAGAARLFQEVLEDVPGDQVPALYMGRAIYYQENGTPLDWDGVEGAALAK